MGKTYLELCRAVAAKSGTISGDGLPVSTVNQAGRLQKIVYWTNEAWQLIQNSRENWRWMHGEFEGDLLPGVKRYTAASWNLSRFARWVEDQTLHQAFSTLNPLIGPSDEAVLPQRSYERWRQLYDRGPQTPGRPAMWAVSPLDEFLVGPAPDVARTLKGEYYKTPQVLAQDGDVPELPARFHDIIVYRALILLAEYDEAGGARDMALTSYSEMLVALEREMLPRIGIGGGPIA